MFYSTRHFFRIIIILIIVFLIIKYMPSALDSLKHFINYLSGKLNHLVQSLKT